MSDIVERRDEIPNAPFYVLSNDTFMSGWGRAHTSGAWGNPHPDQGALVNTIILPCSSAKEAETVASNARRRTDQRRVRIVTAKPRLRPGVVYSLMSREESSRWYQPGAFSS